MFRRKKVYEDILYANCWEDPEIDRKAFGIKPEDVVFSITSGGCNVLTFLLDNPQKIISLDLNPHQNYMLELKMSAFKNLNYYELLGFMGVKHSVKRDQEYKRLRDDISDQSRVFWDSQAGYIEKGIINCGRFERYMRLLGKTINILFKRKLINKFYQENDKRKKEILFRDEWKGIIWSIVKRVLLSRATMSLLFDKDFFKYLDDNFSFGNHFENKICSNTASNAGKLFSFIYIK